MATIDPFIIDLSGEWYKNPESLNYLNQFLHNVHIVVTGGTGSSLIEDANIAEKYPWPLTPLAEESKEFNYPDIQIPIQSFRSVTASSSYTAVPFDFINAKGASTITFPKYPDENSVIIIRNGDGTTIPLNGNGKDINGSSTGFLRKKTTAIEFHYFIDSDEWFAR